MKEYLLLSIENTINLLFYLISDLEFNACNIYPHINVDARSRLWGAHHLSL